MVACPEEIAFRYGYINAKQLEDTAPFDEEHGYGSYLQQLLREKVFENLRHTYQLYTRELTV